MRHVLLTAMLALLTACAAEEAPSPPRETVFDPLLEQRDRAKDMAEKLPQERKDSLDQAIDANAQ
jgi:hypothetical protein